MEASYISVGGVVLMGMAESVIIITCPLRKDVLEGDREKTRRIVAIRNRGGGTKKKFFPLYCCSKVY